MSFPSLTQLSRCQTAIPWECREHSDLHSSVCPAFLPTSTVRCLFDIPITGFQWKHSCFYLTLNAIYWLQFSSVQSLSHVQLFATPWIAVHQASLSITISRSSLKLMSIESVMPSSHLILCHPLLLLPLIPPSIRVFSNESTLCMRWPKYWSFSFSIVPSKEHPFIGLAVGKKINQKGP